MKKKINIALLSNKVNAKSVATLFDAHSSVVQVIYVFEETVAPTQTFRNIYTFCQDKDSDYRFLLDNGIMLVLIYGWNHLIPSAILDQISFFNIHPSLLPKYRGPIPLVYQLLQKEEYMGVTLHKVTQGFDTGPIYRQKKFKADHNNPAFIYLKTAGAVIQLVKEFLTDLIAIGFDSQKLVLLPQNNEDATYFSYKDIGAYTIHNTMSCETALHIFNTLHGILPVKIQIKDTVNELVSIDSLERPDYIPYALADKTVFVQGKPLE